MLFVAPEGRKDQHQGRRGRLDIEKDLHSASCWPVEPAASEGAVGSPLLGVFARRPATIPLKRCACRPFHKTAPMAPLVCDMGLLGSRSGSLCLLEKLQLCHLFLIAWHLYWWCCLSEPLCPWEAFSLCCFSAHRSFLPILVRPALGAQRNKNCLMEMDPSLANPS